MNRFLQTIVFAGLAVGVLDGIAAVLNAGIRGVSPDRVFQYISSGILGRNAFDGGVATIALGVALHFAIAFGASAVFIVGASWLTALNRYWLVSGPLYGIAVYFFMSELVTNLSSVSRGPRTMSGTLTGILIHIFCVGLPIALISARSSKRSAVSDLS
jgi:hypothetical protein